MPMKSSIEQLAIQKKYKQRNKEFVISYLNTHPCTDCGTDDLRVLEFDHLPEHEKKFSIARSISSSTHSLATLQNEIAKCEVVCANCHRIRTLTRQGTSPRLNWNNSDALTS